MINSTVDPLGYEISMIDIWLLDIQDCDRKWKITPECVKNHNLFIYTAIFHFQLELFLKILTELNLSLMEELL